MHDIINLKLMDFSGKIEGFVSRDLFYEGENQ